METFKDQESQSMMSTFFNGLTSISNQCAQQATLQAVTGGANQVAALTHALAQPTQAPQVSPQHAPVVGDYMPIQARHLQASNAQSVLGLLGATPTSATVDPAAMPVDIIAADTTGA